MSTINCDPLLTKLHDCGEFIEANDAQVLLGHYLSDAGTPQLAQNDPNHVIGYLFGLNNIRELLLKIDRHNSEQSDPEMMIDAIRIYNSKSLRTDPDFPTLDLVRDVFLIPVRRNGKDFPKEMLLTDPQIILSGSRPCPNQCNRLFFYTS